nr:MAG TPA_asm: hypothetical protein [Caudoviricetes sp.]
MRQKDYCESASNHNTVLQLFRKSFPLGLGFLLPFLSNGFYN